MTDRSAATDRSDVPERRAAPDRRTASDRRTPRRRARRRFSRIAFRLLAFNVLAVFLPVAGLVYLDSYEQHLLDTQERAMVQQARLLAAALAVGTASAAASAPATPSGSGTPAGQDGEDGPDARTVDQAFARQILLATEQRLDARIRVLAANGRLLADSAALAPASADPPPAPREYAASADPSVRDSWLYRVGAWLGQRAQTWRARARAILTLESPALTRRVTQGPEMELARLPEVTTALQGRYGAATRATPGQRSVTLSSAIPIRRHGRTAGVVLVSQSTHRLLQALYDVRLRTFEVVVASLLVAALLTLLVSTTIVRPLLRLRTEASAFAARRARPGHRFSGTARYDEIGDLARALDDLTRRLDDHVRFAEQFAADVSHEFKNPLASIKTVADMLATIDDPAGRRRFLELMQRDIHRLDRLVTGVRDVVQMEAQIEREPTERVDLPVLLANIVDAHRLRHGDARVAYAVDAEPDLFVRASPERLAQVFDNIIDNAVGFSPPRGRVAIACVADDGDVVATVDDSGPGFPDAHVTRVFERFFSYRPANPADDRHTGLGLSIAKAIVDGYGGTIVASNLPGGGGRVQVRLRAEPAVEPLPAGVVR